MKGKVKNLLHYPAGFLVDYQLVFDFRVFPVPDGGIGADTLSCGKLRFESGLYLAACIFRKPFISQPRIKNDALCFDISDKIVVDVNVAFLVIVHGIAFADLNFLNQTNQRGTV